MTSEDVGGYIASVLPIKNPNNTPRKPAWQFSPTLSDSSFQRDSVYSETSETSSYTPRPPPAIDAFFAPPSSSATSPFTHLDNLPSITTTAPAQTQTVKHRSSQDTLPSILSSASNGSAKQGFTTTTRRFSQATWESGSTPEQVDMNILWLQLTFATLQLSQQQPSQQQASGGKLSLQEIATFCQEREELQRRIKLFTDQLNVYSKVKETLVQVSSFQGNPKATRLVQEQVAMVNKKIDENASELWKLTQRASEIYERLMQHHLGVALSVIKQLEHFQNETIVEPVSNEALIASQQTNKEMLAVTQELRGELDASQKQVEELKGKVSALEGPAQALSVTQRLVDELEVEVMNLRRELKEKDRDVVDLKSAMQNSLREAVLEKEKLRSTLVATEQKLEELKQKQETPLPPPTPTPTASDIGPPSSSTRKKRDEDVALLQTRLKDAAADIDQLQKDQQEHEDELKRIFFSLPCLEQKSEEPVRFSLDALEERVKALVADRVGLQDKVLKLQGRVEKDGAELERLRAELSRKPETESEAQLRTELQRTKRMKEDAEQENQMLSMTVDAYKARVDDLESRIKELPA